MRIVVIVDMQNDFIDGALGTPEAKAIVPNVIDTLRNYEDRDTLVVFTKDTHYENYLETQEGQMLPTPHCISMTPGWSINKEISEYVDHARFYKLSTDNIIKGRFVKSTFGDPVLAEELRYLSNKYFIEEIIFMGVCTDICVISNALMAKSYCPETKILVDAACCAGSTPEKHNAALDVMESCQIYVINRNKE